VLSRLAPLDRTLVLILVPLWLVCFGLGVRTQMLGLGVVQLVVSVEDAESYPTLTGEYSGFVHRSSPLAAAGLRAGDRLIRLGDADLRGVETGGFVIRSVEQSAGDKRHLPLVYERDGVQEETSLELASLSVARAHLTAAFALVGSAVFLILRARPSPSVSAWFRFGMCAAFGLTVFAGSRLQIYAYEVIWVASFAFYFPTLLHFVFLFPDDRAPDSRWHRIWPWFLAIPFASSLALQFTERMTIGNIGFAATGATGAVAALTVATRKYRGADRIARRQVKWVLFGFYCSALPFVASGIAATIDPDLAWLFVLSTWGSVFTPIALVVSVLWFNLFDIDRILSAAASYNIIAVLLGATALIVIPRIAEAASSLSGLDPETGQILLSLALAALVVPVHRRLRPQIDRVFFKERHELDLGMAELLPALADCRDAQDLTQRLGEGLERLLRPEVCVVYAAVEQSYAPVFVEGRAVPPAFEADSPLIGTLRGRRAPLSLSDSGRRPDEAPLGPFDRAALETLQAEVVIPVHPGGALAGFVCLGPKRSGDVYTTTDVSHLAAVAETLSRQLQLFDRDEVIREGRQMQESLRRYVPGAIADQLSSGAELSSGEREVTVLFVDLRGYTSFSESRQAEEIFSTVNRYTEKVSQLVQRHAGSVVEFNGDGMMAVFGAPRELAHKERAAVEAGREIVAAVGALPVDDAGGEGTKLSVGVGIATGTAFVGNIQAVDRLIWSAIGNTTNLAARLQSLTRELDAAIVIDTTTFERGQPAAADFDERADLAIRGRRETQDVYTLPLTSES
jgi:class 3 adenylate cyclase